MLYEVITLPIFGEASLPLKVGSVAGRSSAENSADHIRAEACEIGRVFDQSFTKIFYSH